MEKLSTEDLMTVYGGGWWSDFVTEAYGVYEGVKRHFL